MSGLNNMQLEACHHTDGPLLILAGAGSGKTRTLVHRIAYLMNERDVNPYNILAITFTNKAAKEMRERIDNMVGFGAESIWVSTFHSMCVRILRKHIDKLGGTRDFSIYDTDEQKVVIKAVMKYLQIDPKLYPDKAVMTAISRAKEKYQTPDEYEKENASSFRCQQIAKIYREYQARLKKNNALDFDDLIFQTIFLFETNPDVLNEYQERFKYIMVDEYQDTNRTQFMLIRMLARKYKNICVVGDDDQSIYKFRGADITNILNFENQYPDAKVIKLEQNYRSTSNILNAANGVIANNEGRKEKKLWTDQEEGEKVTFTRYDNEHEEARGIVSSIRGIINRYGAGLNDIAVLYRTNAQSRVIEEKLLFENIPYKVYGGQNFYTRKEIKDIICYLKLLVNSYDDEAVKRIINVPKRGIGATTVSKLDEFAQNNNMSFYDTLLAIEEVPGMARNVEKIGKFTSMIESVKERLYDGSFLSEMFDYLMEKTGYIDELKAERTDEAQARIDNIYEFKNKIVKYEEESDEPNLTELLEEVALVADVDEEDEDGNTSEKVTLMTLHSSKGLEFPYVFISGMEEGLFPSNMSIDSEDPDAVEEERRLCYVGITRAMQRLYLSAASSRMLHGNTNYNDISRFIKEIPKKYVEMKGMGNYFDETERRGKPSDNDFAGRQLNSVLGRLKVSKLNPSNPSSNPGFGKAFPMNGVLGGKSGALTSQDASSNDYKEGDRVRHITLGKGTITKVASFGTDKEITIDFDDGTTKKLFASMAKMKKI